MTMRNDKRKRLESKGWKIGSAKEFLGLSAEEEAYIKIKLRLAESLRVHRLRRRMTHQSDQVKPVQGREDGSRRRHRIIGSSGEVRVLAARPLRTYETGSTELFGDYDPRTAVIRVWMRTAVHHRVTSFGTFMSTLCHEFCHHLDLHLFGFPGSPHTRGFYERAAVLYHCCRGTPLRRLVWRPCGRNRWQIDWAKMRRNP